MFKTSDRIPIEKLKGEPKVGDDYETSFITGEGDLYYLYYKIVGIEGNEVVVKLYDVTNENGRKVEWVKG